MGQTQAIFKPTPETAQEVAGVASDPAMVTLGKALYFDLRLSESHNISCNTCLCKRRRKVWAIGRDCSADTAGDGLSWLHKGWISRAPLTGPEGFGAIAASQDLIGAPNGTTLGTGRKLFIFL